MLCGWFLAYGLALLALGLRNGALRIVFALRNGAWPTDWYLADCFALTDWRLAYGLVPYGLFWLTRFAYGLVPCGLTYGLALGLRIAWES